MRRPSRYSLYLESIVLESIRIAKTVPDAPKSMVLNSVQMDSTPNTMMATSSPAPTFCNVHTSLHMFHAFLSVFTIPPP